MEDKRVPWFRCFVGRDMMRARGLVCYFQAFPAPDLMTKREEGCLILCGLSVTIRTQSRFPWLSVRAHSDANEITYRRAGDFSRVR